METRSSNECEYIFRLCKRLWTHELPDEVKTICESQKIMKTLLKKRNALRLFGDTTIPKNYYIILIMQETVIPIQSTFLQQYYVEICFKENLNYIVKISQHICNQPNPYIATFTSSDVSTHANKLNKLLGIVLSNKRVAIYLGLDSTKQHIESHALLMLIEFQPSQPPTTRRAVLLDPGGELLSVLKPYNMSIEYLQNTLQTIFKHFPMTISMPVSCGACRKLNKGNNHNVSPCSNNTQLAGHCVFISHFLAHLFLTNEWSYQDLVSLLGMCQMQDAMLSKINEYMENMLAVCCTIIIFKTNESRHHHRIQNIMRALDNQALLPQKTTRKISIAGITTQSKQLLGTISHETVSQNETNKGDLSAVRSQRRSINILSPSDLIYRRMHNFPAHPVADVSTQSNQLLETISHETVSQNETNKGDRSATSSKRRSINILSPSDLIYRRMHNSPAHPVADVSTQSKQLLETISHKTVSHNETNKGDRSATSSKRRSINILSPSDLIYRRMHNSPAQPVADDSTQSKQLLGTISHETVSHNETNKGDRSATSSKRKRLNILSPSDII